MKRLYSKIVENHFKKYQQMLFLSGPRQVGKTTLALATKRLTDNFIYLNWDEKTHRKIILDGTDAIITHFNLNKLYKKQTAHCFLMNYINIENGKPFSKVFMILIKIE